MCAGRSVRQRTIATDRLVWALDYCLTRKGGGYFGIGGGSDKRAHDLRLVATDIGWTGGTGPEVRGPGEAILMAIKVATWATSSKVPASRCSSARRRPPPDALVIAPRAATRCAIASRTDPHRGPSKGQRVALGVELVRVNQQPFELVDI